MNTPRTDAARASCRSLDDLYGCQPLERLARTLETELARAQERIRAMEGDAGEFQRIVEVSPPYDKRHADPKKNYGVHGMTLRFLLKGQLGVMQFVYYTSEQLPHVSDEWWNKHQGRNPFKGMGADIGYHSPKPMYNGQRPMDCDLLRGGKCYYDGTSLGASEFAPTFLELGTDAVWEMLGKRYRETFEAMEAK